MAAAHILGAPQSGAIDHSASHPQSLITQVSWQPPAPSTGQTDWASFFRDKKPGPREVRDIVRALSEEGRHDQVVACLEQALAHGQGAPWMYEVLALSMEVVQRPAADIERVLLSAADLAAQDAGSLLQLAFALARFERWDRTWELIEQSAQIDPARIATYRLALSLGAKRRADHWIAWAAPRQVQYAVGSEREVLVREAVAEATRATERFVSQGQLTAANQLRADMQSALARDLVVRLEWNGSADLDLSIQEPGGTICGLQNRRTSAGGVLAREGVGPRPEQTVEEYECPVAMAGEYTAVVQWIRGDVAGKRIRLVVQARANDGSVRTITQNLIIGSDPVMLQILLTSGRRVAASPELTWSPSRAPRDQVRLNAQFAAGGGGAVAVVPVPGILRDGTALGLMGLISGDRRFVRMGVNVSQTQLEELIPFLSAP